MVGNTDSSIFGFIFTGKEETERLSVLISQRHFLEDLLAETTLSVVAECQNSNLVPSMTSLLGGNKAAHRDLLKV